MNIFRLIALHLSLFNDSTCIEHLDELERACLSDLERIRAKRELMKRRVSVASGKLAAEQMIGAKL